LAGSTRSLGSHRQHDAGAPTDLPLYNVHGNVSEWTEDCFVSSNHDGTLRTSGEGERQARVDYEGNCILRVSWLASDQSTARPIAPMATVGGTSVRPSATVLDPVTGSATPGFGKGGRSPPKHWISPPALLFLNRLGSGADMLTQGLAGSTAAFYEMSVRLRGGPISTG
jgi:hypothetical protein